MSELYKKWVAQRGEDKSPLTNNQVKWGEFLLATPNITTMVGSFIPLYIEVRALLRNNK